ncbi:MAG: MAPEG family protein [Cyanobacteria bacterium J06555_12]
MTLGPLLLPMIAHIAWVVLLYTVLTLVRAPSVWGIGKRPDGSNPWADLEPRVSANLSNQFEWPLLFYAACAFIVMQQQANEPLILWLSWIFVLGRIVHSCVQIFTANIRLRGIVFTINFLAVLGMWGYLGLGILS